MGIRAPMIATPNQFLALALFPHAFTRSEPFVRICSIGGGQNRTSSVNSCTRRVARFDTGSYRSIQYRRNIFTVNIWAHCNTQSERERERESQTDRSTTAPLQRPASHLPSSASPFPPAPWCSSTSLGSSGCRWCRWMFGRRRPPAAFNRRRTRSWTRPFRGNQVTVGTW